MTKQIADNARALTDPMTVYWYRGVPWVPHYTKANTYVAPGSIEMSADELHKKQAGRKTWHLWPRFWYQKKAR